MFRKENQLQKSAQKLGEAAKIIPAPNVLEFFKVLADAYKENQHAQLELAKLEAQKEIVLSEIKNKYELYYKVFDAIFDERKTAIHKSFEIIDRGLASNNKEMIGMGLQGLSKIVSSSPFSNIHELTGLMEGRKIIEI
ncbi:hypothetical protein A7K91_15765 [Paenibacillus oryzae]|uniref:Uncharacterized protein n=1 Tax=Paenibacillus oryzae TaxID=1844972 RepID=A0A1A5YB40_9BACL|nr:hypothetical protein [Paenibacillus oryzae]OBR62844.1 hypothetical protein A7K91_15765 [Paenibacillus oryzae]